MARWLFKHQIYSLIFLNLIFILNSYSAHADTELITLQHRTPQELVPILTPFLNKEGVIKAFENQLIIQSNTENLANLKKMALGLDKAPKKLLLSVSHSKDAPNEQFSVDVNGRVIFGEDSFTLNDKTSTTISTTISTSREENQSLNQIQVLSGTPAMITSGKTVALVANRGVFQDKGLASLNQTQEEQSQSYSVPTDSANTVIKNTASSTTPSDNLLTINPLVPPPPLNPPTPTPTSVVTINPVAGGNVTVANSHTNRNTTGNSQYHTGAFQEQYLYDNLESGAIIIPTLIGNQVRLDITLQNEVPVNQADSNIKNNTITKAMQKTKTVMDVPLGEWTYVGGNQADAISNSISTQRRTKNRDESKMSIWVRVDKIGE